jgi:hypothetical protein
LRQGMRGDDDATAAMLILQSYLDRQNRWPRVLSFPRRRESRLNGVSLSLLDPRLRGGDTLIEIFL